LDEGYEGHTFINIANNDEEWIIRNINDNIDNYILLSIYYYYCEETEITLNYKCTFSLEGYESTGVA
jgi:hypothetical protein